MILFKDWYKKANDDIQPNEELLARILAQNSLNGLPSEVISSGRGSGRDMHSFRGDIKLSSAA